MILTGLLGTGGDDPLTDVLRVLAAADAPGPGRPSPGVLVAAPRARSNPFAGLLYRDLPDVGVVPVVVADVPLAAELVVRLREVTDGLVGTVLHLHWLHRVTATARDASAAQEAVTRVETALLAARDAGTRLVWTIHNLAPHRPRYPDAELRLRRVAAELADVVHVMDPRTPELVAASTPLDPAKVRLVPHPSYAGAQPDTVTRAGARQRLGIPASAVVFAALGRIQPYKGLDLLAEAFEALSAEAPGRHRLVVAGAVDGVGPGPVRARPGPSEPGTGDLVHRLARARDVVCLPLAVADADLQVVLRAADLAVVPNLAPLNSGAQALALTFGVPVVTTGHVPAGADWGIGVAPGDPRALEAGLREALRRLTGPGGVGLPGAAGARAAALAAAAEVAPAVVGPAFARVVRDLLDSPATTPPHPRPTTPSRPISPTRPRPSRGGQR